MRNRFGEHYSFEKINDNTFMFNGPAEYYRVGSKEGQERCDENDLGFFDPSGGPFISIGYYSIEGRTVTKIFAKDGNFYFEVE